MCNPVTALPASIPSRLRPFYTLSYVVLSFPTYELHFLRILIRILKLSTGWVNNVAKPGMVTSQSYGSRCTLRLYKDKTFLNVV